MPRAVLGPVIAFGLIAGLATGGALAAAVAPRPVLVPVARAETTPQTPAERNEHAARAETAWTRPVGTPLVTPLRSEPTGAYVVAAGFDDAVGPGRVVRYIIEVEEGLPYRPEAFAVDVHRILNDPAGWGRGGADLRFVRVDSGPVDFRVALSSPQLTDARCAPLDTRGSLSCFNGYRAVINARRWRYGSQTYGNDLASYRGYLINHEVGHALGRGHLRCRAPGTLAPVMVQQTKSLGGCTANPWPTIDRD